MLAGLIAAVWSLWPARFGSEPPGDVRSPLVQTCAACGPNPRRDFSHPVLARLTIACEAYLNSIADHGAQQADVEEIGAMLRSADDAEAGDIAVLAARSAATWIEHGSGDAAVDRQILNLLADAACDARARVGRNAARAMSRLGGGGA